MKTIWNKCGQNREITWISWFPEYGKIMQKIWNKLGKLYGIHISKTWNTYSKNMEYIGIRPRTVLVTTSRSTKKQHQEMLKFCTSHDHTPGRLEPESAHVMITFQGRGLVKQRRTGQRPTLLPPATALALLWGERPCRRLCFIGPAFLPGHSWGRSASGDAFSQEIPTTGEDFQCPRPPPRKAS